MSKITIEVRSKTVAALAMLTLLVSGVVGATVAGTMSRWVGNNLIVEGMAQARFLDGGLVNAQAATTQECAIGVDAVDAFRAICMDRLAGLAASAPYIAYHTGTQTITIANNTNPVTVSTTGNISLGGDTYWPAVAGATAAVNSVTGTFNSLAASGATGHACAIEGCRIAVGPQTYFEESGTGMLVQGGLTLNAGFDINTSSTGDIHSGRGVSGTTWQNGSGTPKLYGSSTAPTLTGFCTSPSVASNNGTFRFVIDVGTTCAGISTGTITLPAAPVGWECTCTNETTMANEVKGLSGSTTSRVMTNVGPAGTAVDWVDGTDVSCSCFGG